MDKTLEIKGINRTRYFCYMLLIGGIGALLGAGSRSQGNYDVDNIGYLAALIAIPVQLKRLVNIGWSRWLIVLAFIPLVNVGLGLPLLFMPGKYATERKTDRPMILIIWGLCIIFILGLFAAIAIPAIVKIRQNKSTSESPANSGQSIIQPATVGTALVSSTPIGAEVWLDTNRLGVTPLNITDVPVGPLTLTLKASGYEPKSLTGTISIGTNTLSAVLERSTQVATPPPQTQSNLSESQYYAAFNASQKKAQELYSFLNDPNSAGFARASAIDESLKSKDDPLYFDPEKPIKIARMVADELFSTPRAQAKQTQTGVRKGEIVTFHSPAPEQSSTIYAPGTIEFEKEVNASAGRARLKHPAITADPASSKALKEYIDTQRSGVDDSGRTVADRAFNGSNWPEVMADQFFFSELVYESYRRAFARYPQIGLDGARHDDFMKFLDSRTTTSNANPSIPAHAQFPENMAEEYAKQIGLKPAR